MHQASEKFFKFKIANTQFTIIISSICKPLVLKIIKFLINSFRGYGIL